MKLDHILLTTDLSEESLRAFGPAAELAAANGAKLTLLHVVPDLRVAPHGAPLAPPIQDPDIFAEIEAAKKKLLEERSKLSTDLDVHTEVITGENIAETIANYAQENEVNLITMSTHGRTGFRRLVLGSVAEAVLHHAHVPVLCFPRPE